MEDKKNKEEEKIKAVILDFDNTIIDTDKYHYIAFKKALNKQNLDINYHFFISNAGLSMKQKIEKKFPTIDLKTKEKIINDKMQFFKQYLKKLRLKKGFREFYKYLRDNKIRIGLCTGSKKENVYDVLKNKKLSFDFILTADDIEESKPNPEIYIKASEILKKKNISEDQTIIFEDSLPGIISAKRAGFKVCLVKSRFNKNQINELKKESEFFANDFFEAIDLINQLTNKTTNRS